MKRSKKDVLSATKPLTPYMVVDTKTGETLEYDQFMKECLTPLVSYVHAETVRLYKENKEKVDALSGEQYLFAAKHAEQNGLKGDALNLPREVKAKSRINHLIGAKLISETAAYTKNPNKNKQPHRFNKNLTLGVVDSHMARLGREGNDLILTFRCWTRTVEMRFCMPTYLTRRNITGFTLPTIVRAGFVFVTVERPQSRTGTLTAGLDLGRKEPFTLAVVNEAGKPVAQYTARPIVKAANNKRERILKEIPHLRRKITAYKALGLSTKTLETEVTRMRSKAERMGGTLKNEVAADTVRKVARHSVAVLHIEDLTWVTTEKGMSRWTMGKTATKIEHTGARHGVKVVRVNAANTSQQCHKCREKVTHNTTRRVVLCKNCKTALDRDFNAALNIAKKQGFRPFLPGVRKRGVGENFSPARETTGSPLVEITVRT